MPFLEIDTLKKIAYSELFKNNFISKNTKIKQQKI